jgi:hypothetical protein
VGGYPARSVRCDSAHLRLDRGAGRRYCNREAGPTPSTDEDMSAICARLAERVEPIAQGRPLCIPENSPRGSGNEKPALAACAPDSAGKGFRRTRNKLRRKAFRYGYRGAVVKATSGCHHAQQGAHFDEE